MRKGLKKIIFSKTDESFEDLLTLLEFDYNNVINDLYNGFFHYIKTDSSKKEKMNLCLLKINYVIENETDLKKLKLLSKKTTNLLKDMENIKYKDQYTIVFIESLKNMINEKIISHSQINLYNLGHYLIFDDRSIDRITNFITSNKNLLKLKDEHEDDLFYNILTEYVKLEEDDEEEINYYRSVIDLFLINENYDIILNNRLYYLTLLQLPDNIKKEHVKRIVNRLQIFYKVPIEELEKKYDIRFSFPKEVEEEVFSFTSKYFVRENLLHQNVVTIDSEYAECFDDGLYLEKNKDGTYTLYIHISAVSDILDYNSLVRQEAFKRGKTMYLMDNRILMYPSYLSNELCSLKQGNNRNVFSFIFKVDSNFNIIDDSFTIQKSKINVKHRLSYEEADQIMFLEEENLELKEMLQLLSLISYKLRSKNKKKEKYRKIENTVNHSVYHESRYADLFASANIVQELMILANQHVAKYFNDRGLPFIYRVHETKGNNLSIDEINKLLTKNEQGHISTFENKKLLEYISSNFLTARYSPDNLGHEGLNLDTYSHATSAIWRYCDSELQYLMNEMLFSSVNDKKIYELEDRVKEVCTYLNYRDVTNTSFKDEYEFLVNRGLIRKKVR